MIQNAVRLKKSGSSKKMAKTKVLEFLEAVLAEKPVDHFTSRITFPAPIAKTLGIKLSKIGEATCEMTLDCSMDRMANPMGTLHGGVMGDLADAAIGTAHSTTLEEGES